LKFQTSPQRKLKPRRNNNPAMHLVQQRGGGISEPKLTTMEQNVVSQATFLRNAKQTPQ
jgi:hypothetical protein